MAVGQEQLKQKYAPVFFGTTAPSSPKKGWWWFDENVKRYKYYDGTQWIDPGAYA